MYVQTILKNNSNITLIWEYTTETRGIFDSSYCYKKIKYEYAIHILVFDFFVGQSFGLLSSKVKIRSYDKWRYAKDFRETNMTNRPNKIKC